MQIGDNHYRPGKKMYKNKNHSDTTKLITMLSVKGDTSYQQNSTFENETFKYELLTIVIIYNNFGI